MEFVMVVWECTGVAKPLSLTEDSGTLGTDMARYRCHSAQELYTHGICVHMSYNGYILLCYLDVHS